MDPCIHLQMNLFHVDRVQVGLHPVPRGGPSRWTFLHLTAGAVGSEREKPGAGTRRVEKYPIIGRGRDVTTWRWQ